MTILVMILVLGAIFGDKLSCEIIDGLVFVSVNLYTWGDISR